MIFRVVPTELACHERASLIGAELNLSWILLGALLDRGHVDERRNPSSHLGTCLVVGLAVGFWFRLTSGVLGLGDLLG